MSRITVILSGAMIWTFCAAEWGLAQSPDVRFEATPIEVGTGPQTVVVAVTISDTADPPHPIQGYSMALTHDPTQLQVISVGQVEFGVLGFEDPRIYGNGWTLRVIHGHGSMAAPRLSK